MRLLPTLALASSMTAGASIMNISPTEKPTDVMSGPSELEIRFDGGSTARFTLDAKKAARVELYVTGRHVSSELRTCTLPSSIVVDGMELIRDDLRQDEHRSDSFTLLFDVGPEPERRFGRLPRVQLSWFEGSLVTAIVSRQIAMNSGFSSPLCDPDVQPNNSLERSHDP